MQRVITSVGLLLLCATLALAEGETGTYYATTGASAATASGAGSGGRGRGVGTTSSTTGGDITMTISSFSSEEELEKLKAQAGDPQAFLKTLSTFRHGTVKIGKRSVPVHAAWTVSTGSRDYLFLLSAKGFELSRSGHSASGGGAGYIKLTVDDAGDGKGVLYSTAQVVFKANGQAVARGGASSATQLTDVHR